MQRECEHIKALRQYLKETGISIWGEGTEEPHGWVNVYCGACEQTWEISLRK